MNKIILLDKMECVGADDGWLLFKDEAINQVFIDSLIDQYYNCKKNTLHYLEIHYLKLPKFDIKYNGLIYSVVNSHE